MSQQTLFDLFEKKPVYQRDDGAVFHEKACLNQLSDTGDRPVKYVCLSECIKRRLCWWCAKTYVPDYTPDVDPEPYSIPTPPICAECEEKRLAKQNQSDPG